MARGRAGRRSAEYGEFWPGYVDVLSTLLLVFTFLLSIFMIAQYFVSQEAGSKDTALKRLTQQVSELTSLLSLEKGRTQTAEDELSSLQASLASLRAENTRLENQGSAGAERAASAAARLSILQGEIARQKEVSGEALAKVDLLNQQILALRRQIAALNNALEASEAKATDSQDRIRDLGQRLNAALARQVQELQRYRSDFFGRLRDVLRGRRDIRVVGDRFVFQSEVLFASGDAEVSQAGTPALDQLASAIIDLSKTIPSELDWALQVDGHTDIRPINSAEFPSNWELSAARALSVVRYLISRGVPANRLIAAGHGEFRPLERGTDDATMRRNRRIELKLTNR
ncbi:MAG: peptidoglycan -binding protein [Pseudomonadota bacterium]